MNNNQQTKLCVLALLAVFSLVTGACPISAHPYHTVPQMAVYDTHAPSQLGTVSPVTARLSTVYAPLQPTVLVRDSSDWWLESAMMPPFSQWDQSHVHWPSVPAFIDESAWWTASPAMRAATTCNEPAWPSQIDYGCAPDPISPVTASWEPHQFKRGPDALHVYVPRPWYS